MTRVVKDPEERKAELLDAAEALFIEKGFEQTLVSDIVKKLGVAQGTFYYYFKSKDEMLIAILERKWDLFLKTLTSQVINNLPDPLQKLNGLFQVLFSPIDHGQDEKQFFKQTDKTELLNMFHQQFDEIRAKKLKPIIQQIVKEGIEAKQFKELRNHQEISEIILYGINSYMHYYYPDLSNKDVYNQKIGALEELFEVIFGLEIGSFRFRS